MMALLSAFSATAIGAKLEKIALYALAIFLLCTTSYVAGISHERHSAEVEQLRVEIATMSRDKKIADDAAALATKQTAELAGTVEQNEKVINEYRTERAAAAAAAKPVLIGPTRCPVAVPDVNAGGAFLGKLRRIEGN